jgi:hypothetical protein
MMMRTRLCHQINERREKQSFPIKYIAYYLRSEQYIPGSRRTKIYFDGTLHKTSTGSSVWLVSPVNYYSSMRNCSLLVILSNPIGLPTFYWSISY